MNNKIPRGLRNNNPGNIRLSKDRWQGLCAEQKDASFFQFTEMKYGYRALIRILQNYRIKHACLSIADFIRRWAPANENNTNAYIHAVCDDLNVTSMYIPDITDKDTMCALVAAISYHENGLPANMTDVYAGWELL